MIQKTPSPKTGRSNYTNQLFSSVGGFAYAGITAPTVFGMVITTLTTIAHGVMAVKY